MSSDEKISELTALGAAPATSDLLPIVDVSDTTDGASGTTKKFTIGNLFTSPTLVTPNIGAATATTINSSGLITASSGITFGGDTINDDTFTRLKDMSVRTNILPSFGIKAIPEAAAPAEATFSRASAATRWNRFGVLESITTNGIRHDYDPATGEYKGWLRERASTNLALRSEEFDNAYWTKTRSSISADAAVAPDGTTTADKLVEDTTASATHTMNRSFSFTSGSMYTVSFFVERAGRGFCSLLLPTTAFGANQRVDFNLVNLTGTIGLGTPTFEIQKLKDDRIRISITATATATTSGIVILYLANSVGTISYTGDGTSGLFVWGAQAEVQNHATSYIKTEGSTVTRAADIFYAPVDAAEIDVARGTLYIEAQAKVVGNTEYMVTARKDGNNNNWVRFNTSGFVQGRMTVGGITEYNPITSTTSAIDGAKAAFAYRNGRQQLVADDEVEAAGTAAVTPPDFTNVILGGFNTTAGGSDLSGWIKRFAVFPLDLTQADMEAICLN